MIFLALQTFSKKRQEPSSCAPAVGSALTVFVQSAGVFKFAKFLFCLGGQMVRDIDLDRHVLIAMDGRILHGNNAFATESDLAAGLNAGRNLAFHTALQSIHNGLTAKNSSCKRKKYFPRCSGCNSTKQNICACEICC